MDEEKKPIIRRSYKIAILAFLIFFIGLKAWQYHWPTMDVQVNQEVIGVQVAQTIYQMEKGLGGRKTMGAHDGMLFPLSFPSKQAIVMREMHFPIDIVWIYQGVVVDIAPNVPIEPGVPENALRRYYPRTEATAVLELPAGWTGQHGLKIGDPVSEVDLR